jgi:hypothetical protein
MDCKIKVASPSRISWARRAGIDTMDIKRHKARLRYGVSADLVK